MFYEQMNFMLSSADLLGLMPKFYVYSFGIKIVFSWLLNYFFLIFADNPF